MKTQSKEKYSQLIQDGFCIVPGVLTSELLEQLKIVTDRLCRADDVKVRRRFRSQGSMLSTMCDPIFAELIAWPTALSLFTQMGFDTPTFTDGYIISKPPNSPPLFWHYDWFAWDDPSTYDKRPQQVFFMYLT